MFQIREQITNRNEMNCHLITVILVPPLAARKVDQDLLDGCKEGDMDKVKSAVNLGANINFHSNADLSSPLYSAAIKVLNKNILN